MDIWLRDSHTIVNYFTQIVKLRSSKLLFWFVINYLFEN
jgi:hypothetical protein